MKNFCPVLDPFGGEIRPVENQCRLRAYPTQEIRICASDESVVPFPRPGEAAEAYRVRKRRGVACHKLILRITNGRWL